MFQNFRISYPADEVEKRLSNKMKQSKKMGNLKRSSICQGALNILEKNNKESVLFYLIKHV